MAHYLTLSMPKADAVALLGLARIARNGMDRPLTVEELRAMEALEYRIEGRDRRKTNRHNTPKPAGKRMGYLDVRRTA